MTSFSQLRIASLFLVGVVVAGVVGYRLLEDYSWLDSLYMTVITLTTVGFQEIRPLSPTGRVFTIVLLVAGLGVVFYTAVAAAKYVVEGEFQQLFGRKRMEKKVGALRDHYLVCGFGRIGEVVCRELASKPVPFVVIEVDEERMRKAEETGYLVLHGDASDEKVLLAARVTQAKGLLAVLATDAGTSS